MNRALALALALVALAMLACSKEPPKPTVEASAAPLTRTTCEQGPWDDAARAKHHATARKLGRPDRVRDKVVDEGTAALTKEERAVYFTQQMLSEVRHGGLYQFFRSPAGNCAVQTKAAVEELGHAGLVNLYVRALERFPDSRPDEDPQTRSKQIDAIPDATHAWDEQTQAINRLSDLDEHVGKYVKAHVR